MGIFAKNYTVEELKELGIEVEGNPKEVPLFDPEEYQEARLEKGVHTTSIFEKDHTIEEQRRLGVDVYEDRDPGELKEARLEMGEDFIEMEKIDDYIEPDYYRNTDGDGADTIEMLYRTIPFEQFRGFMKGNIIKYVTRYDRKNGPEDLIKAYTYLDRLRDYEDQQASAKRMHEQSSEDELDETRWGMGDIDASNITAGVLEIDDEALRQVLGIKQGGEA